jgi:ERO1-like protein alpha
MFLYTIFFKGTLFTNIAFHRHKLVIEQLRNISRIVDCVECEKCRLHGKMKLVSLQIVLKVMFVIKHIIFFL